MYEIYTDGAASKNGSKKAVGGWAYVILKDGIMIASRAESVQPATNNICELLGVINGIKYLCPFLFSFEKVRIYSDSAYIINAVNDKWYEKWEQNGWKTSKKEPVKNKELWEKLIPYFKNPSFKWIKVKGHADNYYNRMVDEMAVQARLKGANIE